MLARGCDIHLDYPLNIKGGGQPKALNTLSEAAAYISRLPSNFDDLLFQHAGASIEAATLNPKLTSHATKALEEALRSHKLLEEPKVGAP